MNTKQGIKLKLKIFFEGLCCFHLRSSSVLFFPKGETIDSKEASAACVAPALAVHQGYVISEDGVSAWCWDTFRMLFQSKKAHPLLLVSNLIII